MSEMRYYFRCPKCDSDVSFSKLREDSQGLGCSLFLLGGILPLWVYASATRRRVQCLHCGFIFRQPPLPRTPISILSTWISSIVIVFSFLGLVMASFSDVIAALPNPGLVDDLAGFIAENPKPVVYALLPMVVLVLAVCVLASWTSNLAAHRKLREEFLTRPGEFREDDSTPRSGSQDPGAARDGPPEASDP